MNAESLAFELESRPDLSVLHLRGELRVDRVGELHALLRTAARLPGPVRVDWSAAEHLDVSVLQALLAFARARSTAGLPVEHTAAGPSVQDFRRLAGLSAAFPEGSGTRVD